jgi:hypothetical protein
MTRTRCLLAFLAGITLTSDAAAQFGPVIGLPTVGQAGIAFRLGGGNLRVAGFIPLSDPYPAIIPVTPTPKGFRQVGPAIVPWGVGYPFGYPYGYPFYPPIAPGFPFPGYGVVNQRVTVQIINPPGFAPGVGLRQVPDTSGIDLDVQGAAAIWGEKPALAKAKGPAKNGQIAKADPPEERKPQVAANQAKAPAVVPPKPEPAPDGKKLSDMGVAAFRNGDYGLAMARLRQAAEADEPAPRAAFLRAQACIAVGKYREAVDLIQQGLQARPDWPTSGFHPRLELYDKLAKEWKEQRDLLEQTQARNPKSADYLFLLGYVAWFEGERAAAVDYFQRSRALAAEPRWADLFLKAAKN